MDLASKHSIHQTLIATRKRQAVEGMAATFSSKADASKVNDTEREKLRAKVGQLVVERDFLSKAFGR